MGQKIKSTDTYKTLFKMNFKFRVIFAVISLFLTMILFTAQLSILQFTDGVIMLCLYSIVPAIYNHYVSKGLHRKSIAEEMVNNIVLNKKYNDEIFVRSFKKSQFFMGFNTILRYYIIFVIPFLVFFTNVPQSLAGLMLIVHILFIFKSTYDAIKGYLDNLKLSDILNEAIAELEQKE